MLILAALLLLLAEAKQPFAIISFLCLSALTLNIFSLAGFSE